MFGYVKPDKENLLVKDSSLYKAVYCGLCETIKKDVSFILPLKLSYDFVFLTMMRSAITGETPILKKGKCKYNPLKNSVYSIPKKSALFSANSALILTLMKIEDDIADSDVSFFKKLIYYPLSRHFSKKLKKLEKSNPDYSILVSKIKQKLKDLSALEKGKCSNIDETALIFGDIMADILSFQLEGNDYLIASSIGRSIGVYIYIIDAVDDLETDYKKGAYNPLIQEFGSVQKARECLTVIDTALAMHTKNAVNAYNLIEKSPYSSIIENTLTLGLSKESRRIMTKNGDTND